MREQTEGIVFPNDNIVLFEQLKIRPVIAWPTVIILAICLFAIAAVWFAYLNALIPLWLGCFINCIAMYYLFSPQHDSMHNAVFKSARANNISLFLAVLPVVPFATGQFLRMMHMQHHRFTNDELDPDLEMAKNKRNAFFGWFLWGFNYQRMYKLNKQSYPNMNRLTSLWDSTVPLICAIVLVYYFKWTAIFLWLVPTFVMSWLICFVFMYLPHHPHRVKHKDQPYKATIIFKGYEWLLSPLMANQNYHLVHHLYPTVPFYRYRKVWEAREQFHNSFQPTIKHLR